MKKIYLVLIALVGISVSCSDEFTNVDPIGSLNDTQLANPTGVDLLLTGAYSVLDGVRNGGIGNGWGRSADNWVADVASDDAHKGSTDGDQPDLYELELYNWQTGNGYFMARWEVLFAGVNRANAVINLIADSDDPTAFTVEKAQAHFLRAHYNFELMRHFKYVPNITPETAKANEYNLSNVDAATALTYELIAAEFLLAHADLPAARSAAYSQAGRPLQRTAQAYLGKVFLYAKDYTNALVHLDAVVASGEYSLHANINDNFRSSTENINEAMFAIQYSADDGQVKQGNATGALNYPAAFGWCCGFYQPTQDLVDAFRTDADGLPLLTSFQDAANDVMNHDYNVAAEDLTYALPTVNVDKRLDYTIGRRGVDYNGYGAHAGKGWIRANTSDISGPYLPKKNIYQADDTANHGAGGWGQNLSGINYHIMRYADVVLMAAEAAVETGNLEKARTYVNLIRARAESMPAVAGVTNAVTKQYNATWTDASVARLAVRFERRLELAMEGHRYFDLVRYGGMPAHMAKYITNEGRTITSFGSKNAVFQAKHTAYPIPLSAIDLSGNALQQNPDHN
jgi:hypothetical protein